MRYFETQNTHRTEGYASAILQLRKNTYSLQKKISILERENKTFRQTNKAYEKAFRTNFSSADDPDTIARRAKRLKEMLYICIRHITDPLVSKESLIQEVGEA